jgi:lipopolysaccharide export system permease protein
VNHLIRNTEGKFILVESLDTQPFEQMHFEESLLESALHPPEQHSLSSLWQQLPTHWEEPSDREAQVLTMFSYKALIPLICLLAVIAPAPFCVIFTRNLHVFLIYSVSIFSLVALFTYMDAARVLSETQIASPLLVISVPFVVLFSVFAYLFARMK